MTKDQYLEMCALLGNEPLESEIPVEMQDFPWEVQLAFELYTLLPMNIAEFSGTYRGKHLEQLGFYFNVYEITNPGLQKTLLKIIIILNSIETKLINDRKPKTVST